MLDEFFVCNLDIFWSSKTKLKERNNSVFGMAIEKHGRITTYVERTFFFKSTNTIDSSPVNSKAQQSQSLCCRPQVSFTILSRKVSIPGTKVAMRLVYRIISSPIVLTGTSRIVSAWNSQMASSLSQIRVLCSTLTMSSFPIEIETNIQAIKSYRFLT